MAARGDGGRADGRSRSRAQQPRAHTQKPQQVKLQMRSSRQIAVSRIQISERHHSRSR